MKLRTIWLLVACSMTIAACGGSSSEDSKTATEHRRKVKVELVSTEQEQVQDPCFDYHDLRNNRGMPERQHWYNHLRTDGGEPDYARYYISCKDGYRWNTQEYQCLRGLLDGEHGGLAWDTNHPPPDDGINVGQAKPKSKMAKIPSAPPDWATNPRFQIEWTISYIEGRYRTIWRTPKPCRAGY